MPQASALESIDEEKYFRTLESIFNIAEDAYMKNDENKKRERLMKELTNHLKLGGKVSYAVVKPEFRDVIMESLEDQNVPYHCIPDVSGNMLFMVKDKHADELLEIQKTYMLTSTDYAKELTTEKMLELYGKHGAKEAEVLTFSNKDMALIAEQKLYKAGVTFAKLENEDGTVNLVASPYSMCSRRGDDLCNFELLYAFEQSKADDMFKDYGLYDLRVEQAKFDEEQLMDFASRIKRGESCIFAPACGEVHTYIESDITGIHLYERAGKGWSSTELHINPEASVEDIKVALSKAADKIDDAVPLKQSEFRRDANFKNNDKGREEAEKAGRPVRPAAKEGSKAKAIERDANQELKPMLEAVNAEATNRLNAMYQEKRIPSGKGYEQKKAIIADILEKKELPVIREFLAGNGSTAKMEMRKEWYDNITEHFNNTHEHSDLECRIDKVKLPALAKRMEKMLTKAIAKDAEPDLSPEDDKDIRHER